MADETAPAGGGEPGRGHAIPYRTILAAIGLVLLAYISFKLVIALHRVLTWMFIAAFFAVVLNPAVDLLVHRARFRRTLAALVVFVIGFGLVGGLLYLLISPIVDQVERFADDLPHLVAEAKAGRGTVGHLVVRYHVDRWVEQHKDQIRKALTTGGTKALKILRKIGNGVAAGATILVLTFLMLVEGPRMLAGGVGILSPPRRARINRIGDDAARAVSGYMLGNLVISVLAALVTYFGLWAFGVPSRTVMAVWMGFADLIPLIGATLGAIPTVAVALLHSTTAAIGMVIVYVVYQQFENHVLQVWIMARTVRLSPLTVLVSLVIGIQLSGLLGALLALPIAGVIKVVASDVYQDRQSRKPLVAAHGTGEPSAPVVRLPDSEREAG